MELQSEIPIFGLKRKPIGDSNLGLKRKKIKYKVFNFCRGGNFCRGQSPCSAKGGLLGSAKGGFPRFMKSGLPRSKWRVDLTWWLKE